MDRKISVAGAVLIASVVAVDAPHAQERVLEEVIVSATKRDESLQSVAGSISAFSAAQIAERSAFEMAEMFSVIPNVNFENTTGQGPQVNIRGVSNTANGVGFEPGSPVFIDEVFQVRPVAFADSLYDIERLEVLRGPQGTLFGKNTIGGLIHVITQRPSDEAEARLSVAGGDYGFMQLRGVINAPMGDASAARLTVVYKERDGWLENRTPNTDDLFGEESMTARFQFATQFTDALSANFKYEYAETNGTGDQIFDSDGIYDDLATSLGGAGLFDRESDSYLARFDWDLGDWTVTSLSAYKDLQSVSKYDQDFTPAPGVLTTFPEDIEVFTQELRAASSFDGPLNFVVGAFYLDQETNSQIEAAFGNDFGPAAFSTDSTFDTRSIAAFASLKWTLSDAASIDAGLRYTDESKDFDFAAVAAGVGGTGGTSSLDTDGISGDIAFNYSFSDALFSYVKYSHGFKSGGFDEVSAFQSGALTTIFSGGSIPFVMDEFVFDDETIDNYELGLKSTFLDGRLRVNLAAFFMQYEDKQEQVVRQADLGGIPVPINTTTNAGEVEIKGLEVEVQSLVTDWFFLQGSVGLLDTEYTDFQNPVGDADFTGNELVRAPNVSASLSGTFNTTFANGMNGSLMLEAIYKDNNFLDALNSDFAVQDAHTMFNTRLGLETGDSRYGIYLWGKNLSDEDVFFLALPGVGATQIPPRMVGVELTAQF
jgi:iron complex outermembrane receptor protein